MKVLVLGATGMLGHVLLRVLSAYADLDIVGTARDPALAALLPHTLARRMEIVPDLTSPGALEVLIERTKPNAVINCAGTVKQRLSPGGEAEAVALNALLPHRLARLGKAAGFRLVQISTDCVFSGTRGAYTECDLPDPADFYGRSRLLGELAAPNTITLRTSLIGPGLIPGAGLLDWFLGSSGPVDGYAAAFFSGLPTVEFAHIVASRVLPRPALAGVWHVSAARISKLELLRQVAAEWHLNTQIRPSFEVVVDRSLDSTRFASATGYIAPPWPELIASMRAFG